MKVKQLIEYLQDAEKEYPGMDAHLLDEDLNQYLVYSIAYGPQDGLIIFRRDEIVKHAPLPRRDHVHFYYERLGRLMDAGFDINHHLCQSIGKVANRSLFGENPKV